MNFAKKMAGKAGEIIGKGVKVVQVRPGDPLGDPDPPNRRAGGGIA